MPEQSGHPVELKNMAEEVPTYKLPPPETKESIWTRRFVILSFWAVVIFFGLPMWWQTTMIYRANLPINTMMDWADGRACSPVFPLRIAIEAPSMTLEEVRNLVKITQHTIDQHNQLPTHQLQLLVTDTSGQQNITIQQGQAAGNDNLLVKPGEKDTALTVRLIPSISASTPNSELRPYETTLNVHYALDQVPSVSETSSSLATFIATELQSVFAEEQATIAYMLSTSSVAETSQSTILTPEITAALSHQSTRAFKYAPTFHLTFSLFTPISTPSSWQIEVALEKYLSPLLESLSSISNFTIDTQVQLYASFSPSIQQPEYDQEKSVWTLRKEDLSRFINAAEWPLSPSIGKGPTINFILYVPAPDQSPLVIKENGGNHWLIPQWGGIHILNSANSQAEGYLTEDMIRPAMLTFSNQLLPLLGVPKSPASLPLRVSTLRRVRAASLLFSASSTLGAMARLIQGLPSIEVPDNVATSVDQTLSRLDHACTALREGNFQTALEHARIADTEAEKAFFDPAMVGQVYFPDEHKVAVYLPLLGPVAVPLLLAALKEVKKLKG